MPHRLVLLAALALAACSTAGRGDAVAAARVEAAAHARQSDSLRYVSPHNRAAADPGLVYEYLTCASYTFDSASGQIVR